MPYSQTLVVIPVVAALEVVVAAAVPFEVVIVVVFVAKVGPVIGAGSVGGNVAVAVLDHRSSRCDSRRNLSNIIPMATSIREAQGKRRLDDLWHRGAVECGNTSL